MCLLRLFAGASQLILCLGKMVVSASICFNHRVPSLEIRVSLVKDFHFFQSVNKFTKKGQNQGILFLKTFLTCEERIAATENGMP